MKPTHGGARPGAGRPPLPPSEVRSERIELRATEAQRATLVAWAEREGRTLSEMLVERGMRAARRVR